MAGPADHISIKVENYARCALQTPRWWGGEAPAGVGRVLVAGGTVPDAAAPNHETGTTDIEVLDFLKCESTKLGQLQSAHQGSQPQVLRNGQTVFFGGMKDDIIEIVTGTTVRSGGKLVLQRSAAASVELPDGRVLITGGYHNDGGKATPVAAVEVYDPKTGKSIATNYMTIARASHTITPIGGGKYLLVGGAQVAAQTAEIFDVATMSFTRLTETPRGGMKDHRAVPDNSGRIWFIGGTNAKGQSSDVPEYYDIKSGKFLATNMELMEGREDVAAKFIPELNVIVVVGGEKKGTFGGQKDPSSNAIEVLDLDQLEVKADYLANGNRDEPTLQIISVDAKTRRVELLMLQGVVETANHQKRVPAPEKITIQLK